MTLTGKETNYYVARKNTNTNEDSVLRFNSYNGMFSVVQDFDGATKYNSFDEVKQLVQVHNMMANITGQPYEYYAMKHDIESFRLDENGDVVTEEEPEQEVPTDTEPTE